MRIRSLIVLYSGLVFFSCSDNPTGPGQIQLVGFGLSSSASYSWSFIEQDSLGQTMYTATDSLVMKVASTNDVVGSDSGLTRIESYSIPHYSGTAKVWFKPDRDSLLEVAYAMIPASNTVFPKRAAALRAYHDLPVVGGFPMRTPMAARMFLRSRGVADSIIERSDKRVVYRFPLSVGSSWVSFRMPFMQTREVEGYELVDAGTHTYWCARIWTAYPEFGSDFGWFDYVSAQGLVKRTMRTQVNVVTEQNPDGPGTLMWIDESYAIMD